MRLLLKWLRPDFLPSSKRKKTPLGLKLQLFLYRRSLKMLMKWYSCYAFSDSIMIAGTPTITVKHDFRDYSFEAELRRFNLHIPGGIIVHRGGVSSSSSSSQDKRNRPRFLGCFSFEDYFLLEAEGKKVYINHHRRGRSFLSTVKGRLKESDITNLLAKYAFSGTFPSPRYDLSNQISFFPSIKTGGLFCDDPLLTKCPMKTNNQTSTKTPAIKNVAGVTIDESF